MKGNSSKLSGLMAYIILALVFVVIFFPSAESKIVKTVYHLTSDQISIETGVAPVATFSDSVFCGDRLLHRQSDYRINYRTGRVTFDAPPQLLCDSIIIILFRLPEWMMEASGNKVPSGKKFLVLPAELSPNLSQGGRGVDKVNLSGNKSFSFTVGRAGQAGFSQGLNIDFEAALASGVKVRGSVSDRIGSSGQVLSNGGVTTVLSELDKYFFEIEGTKFSIQGGDITTVDNKYLPLKRIKGMRAEYNLKNSQTQFNIGRPAGRYESIRLAGQDGRQGPYQIVTSAGLPTAVVPSSEKVYLDGQPITGGGGEGQDYQIDYPSGRVTFSPRQLITSRTRIEIDFEASSSDYEQTEMSGWSRVSLWNEALSIGLGGRRETDDEERFRFGSLSANDVLNLQQAGDSSSRAFTSGVISDTSGNYIELSDSTGNIFYQYAGEGQGDYTIGFSFTGEGRGDYFYLGDGVYLYAGLGQGTYMPIRFLPLPRKNDFWAATARFRFFPEAGLKIDYQLTDRDDNLLSALDDGDNQQGRLTALLDYKKNKTSAEFEFRQQQNRFEPARRLDKPDFNREWGLPDLKPNADEIRWVGSFRTENSLGLIDGSGGYLSYRDSLSSKKVDVGLELFRRKRLSPRFRYQVGNAKKKNESSAGGLYERYQTGLSLRPLMSLRFDLDYDRELKKDKYSAVPEVEKYSRYRGNLYYRQTVVTISRRIDFKSDHLGRIGPQLDKISIISEERLGRLSVSGSGLVSRQKRLDSDKSNLESRLFTSTFGYTSRSGWLNFRMEYRQNRQQRHTIGYRYIPALDGQGNYRFEDGEYLFDPDGEFIRLEEERGEAQGVTVGEKNHSISFYPGRLRMFPSLKSILSQFSFRIRTEVVEEQIGADKLQISWVLPWSSNSAHSYLNRLIRERYTALIMPRSNYYVFNFVFTNSFEERDRGIQLNRSIKEFGLDVKTALSAVSRLTISGKHIRNEQSGFILVGLALRENRVGLQYSYDEGIVRITPRIEYIKFTDEKLGDGGGEGHGWSIENRIVTRQIGRGEIRFDLMFRSLKEDIPFTQPEYLVTGGSRFGSSGIIGLVVNYDIGRTMRLTLNLKDKLFQDRSPEVFARGELVASF